MSNPKKDAAIAAARKKGDAAAQRFSAAVVAEDRAYHQARSGEQLKRVVAAEALDELRESQRQCENAQDELAAAQALPDVPAAE